MSVSWRHSLTVHLALVRLAYGNTDKPEENCATLQSLDPSLAAELRAGIEHYR